MKPGEKEANRQDVENTSCCSFLHLLSQCFGQEGEGISSPRPDAKKQRECNAPNLVPASAWNQTVCQHQFTERFTVAGIRQRRRISRSDMVNLTLSRSPSSEMAKSHLHPEKIHPPGVGEGVVLRVPPCLAGYSSGTSVLPSIVTLKFHISFSMGVPASSHEMPSRLRSAAVNSTPPCLAARRFKRIDLASVT